MIPPRFRRPLALAVALLGAAALPLHASDASALKEIFKRWYTGQGGLGNAQIIQRYEIREQVEFEPAVQPGFDVHLVRTVQDHFRIELRRGTDVITQGFDGRLGWQSHPQWGGGFITNVAGDTWVWQNDLLLPARAFRAPIKYEALPSEKLNGHACLVAQVHDATNFNGKVYFDRKTRQLLRIERPPTRNSVRVAVDFDDYRSVDDLSVPFLMRVTFGNGAMIHRRSAVVINGPVDETSFVLSTAQVQQITATDKVLRRHQESIGGAAALARTQTRVTRLSLELSTTGTKSTETISQKTPNLILVELDTPGMGHEARGYDGKDGWRSSDLEGERPLKSAELSALLNEGSIHLVSRLGEACPFRRDLGTRVIDGRPTHVLALANYQGPQGTFYFDQENGRLLRMALPVTGDRNIRTESTIDFSDFRKVDGVEIPFQLVQTNAVMRAASTVLSVQNNVPLDDAIFKPRHED